MKNIIFSFLFLGLSVSVYSQQDPMYSEYMFNGLVINPACAGSHEAMNAMALYRNQWVNMPGAPKTGLFTIDAPLKNQKIGLGLQVGIDNIGVTDHTSIGGTYAFRLKFEKSALSFGFQAGVGFSSTNFTDVKYTDGGQNDAAFQSNFKETLPNFGFGMYYSSQRFFAGISIPQIAGQSIQKAIYGNQEGAHLDLANHYFISTGYLFDLTPDLKFKPSVLLKYVGGAPMEFDVNGVFWFYDLLGMGISYRSLASMNILAQVKISNQLFLGYAYERSTNAMASFSGGSHEIMLQYLLSFSKNKIVTPRFF